jgi:chemotaxis signal transduction protein
MISTADSRRSHAWCLFRSLSQPYAMRLDCVTEVVSVDRLVRLPLGPPELIGLCTIRRDVIPVIGLVDGRPGAVEFTAGTSAVLIVQAGQGTWGIGVNREGISVVDESADGSDEPSAEPEEVSARASSVRKGDIVYTVIHPELAWSSVRMAVERWYSQCRPRDPIVLADPDATVLHTV